MGFGRRVHEGSIVHLKSLTELRHPDPLSCVRTLTRKSSLSFVTYNVGNRVLESRVEVPFPHPL